MEVGRLRTTALVALAAGATIAGAMPTTWARSGELANRVSVVVVIAACAALAVVILSFRPGNRVGRLMLAGSLGWGVGELLLGWGVQGWIGSDPDLPGAAHVAVLGTAVRGASWLVLVLGIPLYFPYGRSAWPHRRTPTRLLVLSMAFLATGCILAPSPLESRLGHLPNPIGLQPSMRTLADLIALGALVLAFATLVIAILGLRAKWRLADEMGRQQLLWFAMAFAVPLLCLPLVATPLASPVLFAAVTAPIPIALTVAVLQRRLYDIDFVVSRSLTYLLVSVAAVAVYSGTIAAVGILLRRESAEWLPWVGAAVVAIAFTPLRVAVQSIANRVTYGHWSAPADVLAATEDRLRDATDLPGLLEAMLAQLASLLRLPRLELLDRSGLVVAHGGHAPDLSASAEELPLFAYGAPVGTMRWTPTSLRSADRRLLEDAGRQFGEALHAAALVEELRRAQERLVIAREEERKRLRRDLHDGLGPSLAALGLEADSLRNRIRALTAEQTDAELVALRTGMQRTVDEVRRVVEGLRPPALDELGLSGAVSVLAQRLASATAATNASRDAAGTARTVDAAASDPRGRLETSVVADLPPSLPAAAEVAAYRIVQEALTNVVRHSGAHHASVSMTVDRGDLLIEVRDDGRGRLEPRDGGVGLIAMRERAEELGGAVEVLSVPEDGTAVRARIPLSTRLGADLPTGVPR